MKKQSAVLPLLASAIGILCLAIDSRSASQSAAKGLELCLKTVIPSLFPMFVLTGILLGSIPVSNRGITAKAERILSLPPGAGRILLLGILGGFPVGAQCIAQAVEEKQLTKRTGAHLLGFCNLCSPGFIFGLAGCLFPETETAFALFMIQLEAALMVAALASILIGNDIQQAQKPVTADIISRSIRGMTSVCAWVILASVVTGFLERWLFPLIPGLTAVIIRGLLEITGGILNLAAVENASVRLILCAVFICFGGISVLMQIRTICAPQHIGIGICVRQKALQAVFGGMLALGYLRMGFLIFLVPPVLLLFPKKQVEIPEKRMYNSICKGG